MPLNKGATGNFGPTLAALPTVTTANNGQTCVVDGVSYVVALGDWVAIPAGGGSTGYNIAEIGSVIFWSGKTNPSADYALLNGQTLSQFDFPDGFAFAQAEVAAGNTDWVVSGTNFTLPNYQNRFLYASGSYTRTAKGGAESVALTSLQSGVNPNGTTGNDTPDHAHFGVYNERWVPANAGAGIAYPYEAAGGPQSTTGKGGATARHHHPLSARNADQAHNNMPPYVVLAMFVKIRGVSASADVITGPSGADGVDGVDGAGMAGFHVVEASSSPVTVFDTGAAGDFLISGCIVLGGFTNYETGVTVDLYSGSTTILSETYMISNLGQLNTVPLTIPQSVATLAANDMVEMSASPTTATIVESRLTVLQFTDLA